MDFKGPVASITKNRYLLVIVNEFSRFPFTHPCADMKASTIIEKLCNLFSLFEFPGYVHTDQGSNFMYSELKEWLHGKGIPASRSTRYNLKGNGQVERFNGAIWKSVLLGLRMKNLSISHWKTKLCDVLHSLRSMLCTATNSTPHKRMFLHLRKFLNGVTMPT